MTNNEAGTPLWSEQDLRDYVAEIFRAQEGQREYVCLKMTWDLVNEYEAKITELEAARAADAQTIAQLREQVVEAEARAEKKVGQALSALRELGEAIAEEEEWEDVPVGVYLDGNFRLDIINGHTVIALRAMRSNGQGYWNGSTMPEEWRIQRRTQPGGE